MEVLSFNDVSGITAAFEAYKAETKSKWRCVSTDALFGKPMADVINATSNRFRVKYKWDIADGLKVMSEGIPFYCVSRKRYQCHQGPDIDKYTKDKRKRLKEETQDQSFACRRKLAQETKKIGCPATLQMARIIKFPQFQVKSLSLGKRWSMEQKVKSIELKQAIESMDKVEALNEYLLFVPKNNTHLYHTNDVKKIEPKGKKRKVEEKSLLEEEPKEKKASGKEEDVPNEWSLEGRKKVTINEFRGRMLVDIREYYNAGGEMKPGKKGISLSVEQWEKLVGYSDEISNAIKKK